MLRVALIVVLQLLALPGFAADGQVVSRSDVVPAAEVVARSAVAVAERSDGRAVADVLADVRLERITYLSEGLRVTGYVAAPRAPGRWPVVIYNRGGNRAIGQLEHETLVQFFAPLAARGYVVVGTQYRGNDGGEGQEEFGGRELADVLALIPLVEQDPRADATRIGMYGRSRGGLTTFQALRRTDRIRAAVVDAAATDARSVLAARPDMEANYAALVPGWTADREAAIRDRSPVLWAADLHDATPVLILQGTSDWRVEPTAALDMSRALFEARHPHRLVMFEGGDHALSTHRREAFREIVGWFDRFVRDRAPPPSTARSGD